MSNYPPILRPAMDLIQKQEEQIRILTEKINDLCDQLGLDHVDSSFSKTVSVETQPMMTKSEKRDANVVLETEKPQKTENSSNIVDTKTNVVNSDENSRVVYCESFLLNDEGSGFFDEFSFGNAPSVYQLNLNETTGCFSLINGENILPGDLDSVCDFEDIPLDFFDCMMKTAKPGELTFDGGIWKVSKKAVIKFEKI